MTAALFDRVLPLLVLNLTVTALLLSAAGFIYFAMWEKP